MTFYVLWSLVVALVGLLLYFFAPNAKIQELGRIMFAAGILAFCFWLGGRAIGGSTP